MIFGKSRLELKVGAFVLIGIIILVVFVLLIGDFKNMFSTYRVNFIFHFINGVRVGAPVRCAGVDVGEVREINFFFSPPDGKEKICIVGRIKTGIKIPQDSSIWVNTLGLLGEKYIDIMPGKDYANLLKDNDKIIGNDPFAMHEFGELAKSIAQKLDRSIMQIDEAVGSIGELAKDIDEGIARIKNKEGTVGRLLYDDTIYKNLDALVLDIKKHPWKLLFKGKEKREPVPEKE